jgi:hypothetical protein
MLGRKPEGALAKTQRRKEEGDGKERALGRGRFCMLPRNEVIYFAENG